MCIGEAYAGSTTKIKSIKTEIHVLSCVYFRVNVEVI